MDSHFDSRAAEAFASGTEPYTQDHAEPVWYRTAPQDAPKAGLSDAASFHILWFSAALLGMPALMAALALLL